MKQFIGFIMITALLMGCATKQKTEVQSQIAQNETPSDTTEEQVVENADSTCAVALLDVKPPCDKPTSQKVVLNEEEQAIFDDVMKACLEDIEIAKKRGDKAFSAEICPKFSEASVLLVRKIKQAVHGN